jgi:heme exporter protein CcmD
MEWLDMGRYGLFVWGSYALALSVLIICAVQAKRRQQQVFREIARNLQLMESEK